MARVVFGDGVLIVDKATLKAFWFLSGLVVFAFGAIFWLVTVSARFFWEIKLVNDYGFVDQTTSHAMLIGMGILLTFCAFYVGSLHDRVVHELNEEPKSDVRQLQEGQKKVVGR